MPNTVEVDCVCRDGALERRDVRRQLKCTCGPSFAQMSNDVESNVRDPLWRGARETAMRGKILNCAARGACTTAVYLRDGSMTFA